MAACTSARELLERVVDRYRGLDRYTDTGQVRRLGRLGGAPPLPFETVYDAASGDFRFRFNRAHPYRGLRHLITRFDVGQEAGRPYFRAEAARPMPAVAAPASLDLAIAAATGISAGAAFHTWQLLFQPATGDWLLSLTRPRLRRYSMVAGVRCHRLAARVPTGSRIELHVGLDDLFVRAIVSRTRGDVCVEERRPGEITCPRSGRR